MTTCTSSNPQRSMPLVHLLEGYPFHTGRAYTDKKMSSIEVTGIVYRSDAVSPGDVFFCIVGEAADGHSYAQDAVDRGAVAIIAQRPIYLADTRDVPVIIVESTRKAMSVLASRFYDNPSHHMAIIGVTGTNGKTTTTYLVQHILADCGRRCGVVGTTGIFVDGTRVESSHTTPESADLQHILADLHDVHHCDAVVMEVSSHALALDRVWGMNFAVTAFTNLTQDHLDYHHSFEEYFEAKAKLFDDVLYPAKRVINNADEWGAELARRCSENGDEMLTYSFFESSDIHPLSVSYGVDKTVAQVRFAGKSHTVEYPLVGRFNLENVMCAIGICLSLGCNAKDIVKSLKGKIEVPGRLEHVSGGFSYEDAITYDLPSVYVDYAHTPDAVDNAASAACGLRDNPQSSKTIIVIGCGGDRDKTKRPLMGQAALKRGNHVIITSDNPRTEDPHAIIEDIVAGLGSPIYDGKYEVIEDRREATAHAIEMGHAGDVVLIAGKGHENYQIVGEEKRHFDDREEAAAALQEKAAQKRTV